LRSKKVTAVLFKRERIKNMSSQQRHEVWRGTRAKTSGGLTKGDLIKNKRGKLVSKKKSQQAGSQNNLGSWLRTKGKKVPKKEMLYAKGAKAPAAAAPKPKKAAPKPKPKAAPKPKKAAPKPKPKAAPKPKPKPKAAPKKKARITRKSDQGTFAKGKINPLTKQAYEKTSGKTGYVKGGNISLDNVQRTKLRPRKKVMYAGM
jgi:outer membrane biosynthesis protein TonB